MKLKAELMKKLLLCMITVVSSALVFGQSCTPLQSWADTVDYGVYPDTTQNFPPADVNMPYSTDLNFVCPAQVTPELDPTGLFVGSNINGFVVDAVLGLPAELTYACNNAGCSYAGGENGCANIYGTPVVPDVVYDITIQITATVQTILGAVEQPAEFTGYRIAVNSSSASLPFEILEPLSVSPNPSNSKITLSGVHSKLNATSIDIVDITGKIVKSVVPSSASDYTFDISSFQNGIYIINVKHAFGSELVKFVKK
jgi:hypothetical protein